MAAPMRLSVRVQNVLRNLTKTGSPRWHTTARWLSSDSTDVTDSSSPDLTETMDKGSVPEAEKPSTKLTGFAQAFEKHSKVHQTDLHEIDATQEIPTTTSSFATLLRNSTHVHIGSGKGQIVLGKIFHTVEDDLYIDFGGKFHCVCRRPEEDAEKFHRGVKVRLRLRDVELTDHFIGAARDLSLLEADADLLGLAKS
ncbi:28S ribosomal protein S28, mitochondrial-like [Asterias rubens]|uniref:28S ribosomal protein S28, mitochondrial-like n=1 Tax=Asterias rubens TaxID=7604 RepID=UPI001455BCB5|nr:28S ribosomal protein S28, mitochondrial-like [Asterias rubens]